MKTERTRDLASFENTFYLQARLYENKRAGEALSAPVNAIVRSRDGRDRTENNYAGISNIGGDRTRPDSRLGVIRGAVWCGSERAQETQPNSPSPYSMHDLLKCRLIAEMACAISILDIHIIDNDPLLVGIDS